MAQELTGKAKLQNSLQSMFGMESFMDTIRDMAKKHPEKKFDEYFLTQVYPCLMDGLEDLAEEVEAWHEGDMDPTETKRFNPCFYLAQFLMRNNPLFLDNSKKYNDNNVLLREKKRRIIVDLKLLSTNMHHIISRLKPALMAKIEGRLGGKDYSTQNLTNIFIEVGHRQTGLAYKLMIDLGTLEVDELLNAGGKLKKAYPTLPESAKAREVSQLYTSEHLFKDLVSFYLAQDELSAEDLSQFLSQLLK